MRRSCSRRIGEKHSQEIIQRLALHSKQYPVPPAHAGIRTSRKDVTPRRVRQIDKKNPSTQAPLTADPRVRVATHAVHPGLHGAREQLRLDGGDAAPGRAQQVVAPVRLAQRVEVKPGRGGEEDTGSRVAVWGVAVKR